MLLIIIGQLTVLCVQENRDPNRHHWLLELLMEDPLRDEASFIECGWVLAQLYHSVGFSYTMSLRLHATYIVLLQATVHIAGCSEPAGVACLRIVPPVAPLFETVPDTSVSECPWKAGQVCILSDHPWQGHMTVITSTKVQGLYCRVMHPVARTIKVDKITVIRNNFTRYFITYSEQSRHVSAIY
jgi:hypothetical protein